MSGRGDLHDEDRPPRRLPLGGDIPGRGYGATARPPEEVDRRGTDESPTGRQRSRTTGETRPAAISSRSTEAEAQDLLALRQAVQGDDRAFAELLRHNDDTIRRFLAAMVGVDAMEDATRTCYLKAYRGLPLAPPTSPRLWLLGIAEGISRDLVRRQTHSRSAVPSLDPPIDIHLDPEVRLVTGLVDAVGLTLREAARLISGGPAEAAELLDRGRSRTTHPTTFPEPPDHARDFWNDLGRQLLAERDAPAARRVPADPSHLAERDPGQVRAPHPPRPSRRSNQAARGMAHRVRERSPREIPWGSLMVGLGILSAVLLVVAVSVSTARKASERDAEIGETTAKVLDRLDAALTGDAIISGTVVVSDSRIADFPDGTFTITRSATGSYRTTAADDSTSEAYDVATNQFTFIDRRPDPPTATIIEGVAPGPPSATAVAPDTVGDLLADAVRIVRVGTAHQVATVTLPTGTSSTVAAGDGGSPAWVIQARLSTDLPVRNGVSILPGVGRLLTIDADTARLTVDQALQLPTELEILRGGRVVLRLSFESLEIAQSINADTFTIPVPEDAEQSTSVEGFTTVGVDQARTMIDRNMRTPSVLPDGFVLASVAVDEQSRTVVTTYRAGSRQLTLTVTPARAGTAGVADPFGKASSGSSAKTVELRSGAFSGARAWTADIPLAHLWTTHGQATMTITGDTTTDELVRIASSMK